MIPYPRVERTGELTLVGINHADAWVTRHRNELEALIRSADYVAFESEGYQSVFSELREYAHEQKKQTYAVDVDLAKPQVQKNIVRFFGSSIIVPQICVSYLAMRVGLEILPSKCHTSSPNLAALDIAATYGVYTSTVAQLFLYELRQIRPLRRVIDEYVPTRFGAIDDYRDIVMADNLAALGKPDGVVITGWMHSPGIKYYLEHPRVRRVKRKIYAPLDMLFKPELSQSASNL